MKLTQKLISYLHRVFDKDPHPFLALRIQCNGTGLTWSVSGARLTTAPVGGTAASLSIDLTQFTIATLSTFIAAQVGYSVVYSDVSNRSLLGAATLIDGAGNVAASNGDHLYAYTSVLWSYIDTNAVELEAAGTQIEQMLRQMSTATAEDVWLDELGGYYKVPRKQGEIDAIYGPRIIAEVIRPLANNVAIESALSVINQGLPVECSDYDVIVNGSYGLFDIDIDVGLGLLVTTTYTALALSVIDTIERMRDAGTFLRRLSIITRVQATLYVGSVVLSGETVAVGLAPFPLNEPLLLEGYENGFEETEAAVDLLHILLHTTLPAANYW